MTCTLAKMANRPFRFKQFTVHQDQAPFKVGTDGTLLGAWVNVANKRNILDVGTGTGLIALMLAQRAPQSSIQAIELQSEAARQAAINFAQSPWEISLHQTALQQFIPEEKIDVLVCNPPFFKPSSLSSDQGKNLSRHSLSLDLEDLLSFSSQYLTKDGTLALVLPTERREDLHRYLEQFNFFLNREWLMLPTPGASPKRMLIECSQQQTSLESREFVLESDGRHHYSQEVKEMLRDFYLFL